MGLRPPLDRNLEIKVGEQVEKQIARVYLFWLLGIVVGVVRLRPETVQFGGVAYAIENPDILQGLIFVGCVLYYIGIVTTMYMAQFQIISSNIRTKRLMIYRAMRRKTLVGRSRFDLVAIKAKARIYIRLYSIFLMTYVFLPLFQILFFQQAQFLKGIDAIFQTTSVQDGKIILFSPAAMIGGFLAFAAFSNMISRRIQIGQSIVKTLIASMIVFALFSVADHYIRHQETWTQTLIRFGIIAAAYLAISLAIWLLAQSINLKNFISILYVTRDFRKARQIKAFIQSKLKE